jgi:ribonucleoside-diphosphate reductase beta chain
LKKRGLMLHGLAVSNAFIARDEALHRDFAALLYSKHVKNRLSDDTVHSIIREAVELEHEFVRDSLPVELLGMNSTLMCQYIEFVADHLVKSLGHPELYGSSNPFDFMENISLESRVNFFESRNDAYQMGRVMSTKEENKFTLDADF